MHDVGRGYGHKGVFGLGSTGPIALDLAGADTERDIKVDAGRAARQSHIGARSLKQCGIDASEGQP